MRPRLPGIITLSRQRRRALHRRAQKTHDAALSRRYLIIVLLSEGRSSVAIQSHLKVARAHVSRTAHRFASEGEAGLLDRRQENGDRRVDEDFMMHLQCLLQMRPNQCGWQRSTWSRELLARELEKHTGKRLSRTTIGRYLSSLRARWGRARPLVLCPWRKARRQRRLRQIRKLLTHLSHDEEGSYVDEVDIDLNPRIGPDWILSGQQLRVLTPGRNEKFYLAGALNHRTGNIVWAEGDQKRSWLFLNLLRALIRTYR